MTADLWSKSPQLGLKLTQKDINRYIDEMNLRKNELMPIETVDQYHHLIQNVDQFSTFPSYCRYLASLREFICQQIQLDYSTYHPRFIIFNNKKLYKLIASWIYIVLFYYEENYLSIPIVSSHFYYPRHFHGGKIFIQLIHYDYKKQNTTNDESLYLLPPDLEIEKKAYYIVNALWKEGQSLLIKSHDEENQSIIEITSDSPSTTSLKQTILNEFSSMNNESLINGLEPWNKTRESPIIILTSPKGLHSAHYIATLLSLMIDCIPSPADNKKPSWIIDCYYRKSFKICNELMALVVWSNTLSEFQSGYFKGTLWGYSFNQLSPSEQNLQQEEHQNVLKEINALICETSFIEYIEEKVKSSNNQLYTFTHILNIIKSTQDSDKENEMDEEEEEKQPLLTLSTNRQESSSGVSAILDAFNLNSPISRPINYDHLVMGASLRLLPEYERDPFWSPFSSETSSSSSSSSPSPLHRQLSSEPSEQELYDETIQFNESMSKWYHNAQFNTETNVQDCYLFFKYLIMSKPRLSSLFASKLNVERITELKECIKQDQDVLFRMLLSNNAPLQAIFTII